jgi:hypothetical protein
VNRKFLLTITALSLASQLLLPTSGFADSDRPAYPEFKTASGFSRVLQNITGFTPITGWVANRILKRELNRHVQGKLHSRLTLFSGTDLLGGKAKSITITGHNVLLDGYIPISDFRFESKNDMPLYLSKGNRPILLKPVEFKVSALMTEADMNRMMSSEKGRKLLTGMKVTIPPFGAQYLDFMQPSIKLDGGLVTIESQINRNGAPIENALPVKVSGKIAAENSALVLSDLDLQVEGIRDTEEIEQLVEDYFSELVDLNHLKVERHRVKVKIEKSRLVDHRLHLEATVIAEPESKALKKFLSQGS